MPEYVREVDLPVDEIEMLLNGLSLLDGNPAADQKRLGELYEYLDQLRIGAMDWSDQE